MLTAGMMHAMLYAGCIDANGTAYVWGPFMRQRLTEPAGQADVPQVLEGVSSAIALALGARHLVVLMHGGRVATWGASEHGVLGVGSDNPSKAFHPHLLPDISFQQVPRGSIQHCQPGLFIGEEDSTRFLLKMCV
jgi:alpha-tubulin suppressor-like RCC1 family protein